MCRIRSDEKPIIKLKSIPNMPIKYPSKYQPKYYNPNWPPYSQEKLSWDYHEKKKNEYKEYSKSLQKIPITSDAESNKFPKYK